MEVNCDDEEECSGKKVHLDEYGTTGDMNEDYCDEPDEGEIPGSFPSEKGCYFVVEEEDDYDANDCTFTTVPPGLNINEKYATLEQRGEELSLQTSYFYEVLNTLAKGSWPGLVAGAAYGGLTIGVETILEFVDLITFGQFDLFGKFSSLFSDDIDANIALQEVKFNYNYQDGFYNGVICGNDHYWYRCDKDQVGSKYWVNFAKQVSVPFQCYEIELDDGGLGYVWKEADHDFDRDGYTNTEGDCYDLSFLDPYFGCPSLEEEYQGLNSTELREVAKSKCIYPQNHFCAICINPGAPEVCGDKVNNDCGGPQQFEELTQLEGKTSDDCNKNQFACRQEAPPLDNSEDNATGITQTNIYGETFSWINTPDGGYCCGFNGIDDLGKTAVSSTGEGQFLCLNKEPDLVGHDAEYTYESPFCGDEWCWVSASTGVPDEGDHYSWAECMKSLKKIKRIPPENGRFLF
ncbi:hypothetical protein HZC30_07930 [Candidatus Woesearchaeota archaeon]|nr:hypothetical protein [Candidatus Woesearchaeota archaeon]